MRLRRDQGYIGTDLLRQNVTCAVCMAAANTLITEGQQGLHDRHGTSSLPHGSTGLLRLGFMSHSEHATPTTTRHPEKPRAQLHYDRTGR